MFMLLLLSFLCFHSINDYLSTKTLAKSNYQTYFTITIVIIVIFKVSFKFLSLSIYLSFTQKLYVIHSLEEE